MILNFDLLKRYRYILYIIFLNIIIIYILEIRETLLLYYMMFLATLEINVIKNISLILSYISVSQLTYAVSLKVTLKFL